MFLCILDRGSYFSAHVLLNLLNELGKRCYIVLFFATCLKNSIIQKNQC